MYEKNLESQKTTDKPQLCGNLSHLYDHRFINQAHNQ